MFACSLSRVLSPCQWIPPPLPHTASTGRAVDAACLSFLLNHGEMHWRAPIRRSRSKPRVDHFSQVSAHQRDLSGYALKRCATPPSVNTRGENAAVCTDLFKVVHNVRIPEWLKSAPPLRIQPLKSFKDWRKGGGGA